MNMAENCETKAMKLRRSRVDWAEALRFLHSLQHDDPVLEELIKFASAKVADAPKILAAVRKTRGLHGRNESPEAKENRLEYQRRYYQKRRETI